MCARLLPEKVFLRWRLQRAVRKRTNIVHVPYNLAIKSNITSLNNLCHFEAFVPKTLSCVFCKEIPVRFILIEE